MTWEQFKAEIDKRCPPDAEIDWIDVGYPNAGTLDVTIVEHEDGSKTLQVTA